VLPSIGKRLLKDTNTPKEKNPKAMVSASDILKANTA